MLQPFIKTAFSGQSISAADNFNLRLCNAFVAANIPLHALTNPVLKAFLEQETGKKIPDESTLRKNTLHQLYEKVSKHIATINSS